MEQRQGFISGLMKRVILRPFVKTPRLQSLWSMLHTLAIFGMNYDKPPREVSKNFAPARCG